MEAAGQSEAAQEAEPTILANRGLVFRDLLTMTSGLTYPDSSHAPGRYAATVFDEIDQRLHSDNPMGTVGIANRLGGGPLLFQPGSLCMYSTSADIVGAVIEVVSGKRFGDFAREKILELLGMHDTNFYTPKESNIVSQPYTTIRTIRYAPKMRASHCAKSKPIIWASTISAKPIRHSSRVAPASSPPSTITCVSDRR